MKNYLKMEQHYVWGRDLEVVVNKLKELNKLGIDTMCDFNGHTLYSDTVDMDEAYIMITGMNKAEFDVKKKEYMDNMREKYKGIWGVTI